MSAGVAMPHVVEPDGVESAVGGGGDLGAFDVLGLAGAVGAVVRRTGPSAPGRAAALGLEWTRIALGRSDIRPAPRDWRFANRAWSEHPLYRRLAQGYLAWTDAVMGMAEGTGLDWRTEERARFALSLFTSALAPTNQFLLNPEAMERAYETAGLSTLRGLRNIGRDVAHNHGMPRSVAPGFFEAGRNVATTPGVVVHTSEVCELIQYAPTTESVFAQPVVVVPPQINKYYVMDLAPGRSFVEYAVSRGFQVFAVSWRNPTVAQRHWNLDTYVDALHDGLRAAAEITGSDGVSVVGVCAGGLTAAGLMGWLASRREELVRSAAFAVTQMDYDVRSLLGMFGTTKLVSRTVRGSASTGALSAAALALIFSALRPNDLIWNYWVNNNLLGEDPPTFDVMAWNSDGTSLPAALHAQFLDLCLHNTLARGTLSIHGSTIDLGKVECDTLVVGARNDHLVPWKACYANTDLFGGSSEFVLSSSGHVQSLVNPPGSAKMTITTGPEPGADPDEWLASSTQAPGVWWERWATWLESRADAQHRAPSTLGSRTHPPGVPAPGHYVRNR